MASERVCGWIQHAPQVGNHRPRRAERTADHCEIYCNLTALHHKQRKASQGNPIPTPSHPGFPSTKPSLGRAGWPAIVFGCDEGQVMSAAWSHMPSHADQSLLSAVKYATAATGTVT